jgi:glutathione synthase/RimK-type ligase-like ATP-grasp enzyme
MNRVLIIGRKDHGEKNDIMALSSALNGELADATVEYAYFDDFLFDIGSTSVKVQVRRERGMVELESYSHLVFLHWTADRVFGDIVCALAKYAQHAGISMWNSEALQARSTTKLSQMMLATLSGIYVPRTLFSLDHGLLMQAITDNELLPAVCKDVTASRGRYNRLANTQNDLKETLQSLAGRPLMAQEFIPNDKSDIRFVVTGGKVGVVIKRSGSDDTHLTNVSAGGSAELLKLQDIPAETVTEVERLATLFGRELCGIDYMLDLRMQKYVFLEINGTPQIVNGVFVTEKIHAIAEGLRSYLIKEKN